MSRKRIMLSDVKHVNPVARAMLQDRQSPKIVQPKKGTKAKLNRSRDKQELKSNVGPDYS